MKKLSKKELEIVVEEIVGKIKKNGVEREFEKFNESEEGKEILKKIERIKRAPDPSGTSLCFSGIVCKCAIC